MRPYKMLSRSRCEGILSDRRERKSNGHAHWWELGRYLSRYSITSNLSHVSNYSDSVMNYFFTSNSIVHVNNLEYFLL